ncbi:hypothetical protein HX099_07060 [Thiopseudomonas alkaliphila]|uniref:Polyphosphate kinase-2-related domain-containing protein n=1 Tax=Thiopseudomonas alkaliphila TaxID=1697053 RepID=A0AAW7DRW2_9GAMM|nr:hypothetical protein [Thiopseudomonas alkaliphila]MDM1696422.1 hypothetical protein [Thiopseudomonas alkaliphila]
MQRLDDLYAQQLITPANGLASQPDQTFGFERDEADQLSSWIREGFDRQQQLLWANKKPAIVLWLQGADCSGKDGAIRNLLRGLNPQGVIVSDFQKPTAAQQQQHFLSRYQAALPRPGYLSVFNRTPYEGVVSDLADGYINPEQAKARLNELLAFEQQLERQQIKLIKVYLHISKAEQKQRLAQRLINPEKHWKVSIADLAGHRHFHSIQHNWQRVIAQSSTESHPWHILPSNHKWLRNLLLAYLLQRTFQQLALSWPKPPLPFSLEELEAI